MFLVELLCYLDGFVSYLVFWYGLQDMLVYDFLDVFYDGNSQGGIFGGVLVVIVFNIYCGVLGVFGSNYSLLL